MWYLINMTSTHIHKNDYPQAVIQALRQWGRHIRIARLRRGLRMIDLAERVGVSRFLIADIESGKATVAVGSYVCALWALGLDATIKHIADPDTDLEGKALEQVRAPKTAAKRKKVLDNDF